MVWQLYKMTADGNRSRLEAAKATGLPDWLAHRAIERFKHRTEAGLRGRSSFQDYIEAYAAGVQSAGQGAGTSADVYLSAIPDAWRLTLRTLRVAPDDMARVIAGYRASRDQGRRARAAFSDFAGPFLLGASDAAQQDNVRTPSELATIAVVDGEASEVAELPELSPHWRSNLPESYIAWNEAIAREFLGGHMRGRPTYLSIDTEQLEEIAETNGWPPQSAEQDFIEAVNCLLDPRSPSFRNPLRRPADDARSAALPPFIAALALTVLAASRMTSDERYSSSNYYGRLAELLTPRTDSASRMLQAVEGWKAFNVWLDRTCGGRLGRGTARPIDAFTRIGYPLSQCMLRERDRRQIPSFFRWASFVPGDVVAGADMNALLERWVKSTSCTLSKYGRRAVLDANTRALVAELLADELAAWSGDVESATDTRVRTAPVWLGLEFRPGGRVRLLLLPQRPAGFPEVLRIHAPHLGTVQLEPIELDGPWYQPLPFSGDPKLDQEWIGTSKHALRFRGTRVAALTLDSDINCLRQTARLAFDEEALVLAAPGKAREVRGLLAEVARPGVLESTPSGLPSGWIAFSNVRISVPGTVTDSDLQCLVPLASVGASLQGGLRLDSNSWLYDGGEPTVHVRTVINGGPLTLLVDGASVVTLPPDGGSFSLRELGLAVGQHTVQAGGRNLTLWIREGGDPPGAEGRCLPLTIPLARVGRCYRPALGEGFSSLQVGPSGVVRIRGASIIGLADDLPNGCWDPVDLQPCGKQFIILGRFPGEILQVQGHWHRTWPPPVWDKCAPLIVETRFRPVWLARQGRGGKWGLRPLRAEVEPPGDLPHGSPEEIRAWGHTLARMVNGQHEAIPEQVLISYRDAAARAESTS